MSPLPTGKLETLGEVVKSGWVTNEKGSKEKHHLEEHGGVSNSNGMMNTSGGGVPR